MKKTRKIKRNKVLLSIGLIAASTIYAFSQYTGNVSLSVASAIPSGQNQPAPKTSSAHVAQLAPPPKPKPAAGLYTDGSYTGSATDAYYGTVQVKAVIQNGKIASVQFLQSPNGRSTSLAINGRAMPALTSEAIQAQSANVNIVSGATFTSQAFQQSLSSALTQARA